MTRYRRVLGAAVVAAGIAAAASPAAEAFKGSNGPLAYPYAGSTGAIEIELVGAGTIAQVARDGVVFTHPRWAADGTHLVLTGRSAGEGRQLWSVEVIRVIDGDDDPRDVLVTGLHRLTAPGDGENADGAWSPDGRQITYVHTPAAGGVSQVWRMRADGTQRTQLAWSALGSAEPDWSPDGSEIAFTTWPTNAADHGPRIFAMNAVDGTGKRKLSTIPGRRAAWSPAGDRLLFEAVGTLSSIEVIRRDGQQHRTVGGSALPQYWTFHWPRWSPDSTQLVFTLHQLEANGEPAFDRPSFMSLTGTMVYEGWAPLYGTDTDWAAW